MVDYISDPIPHANFGGRRSTSVVYAHAWNITSSFLFFFCFLHHAYRSHFLTHLYDLPIKWHLSGQGCAFGGLNDNWPLLWGRTPKKPQHACIDIGSTCCSGRSLLTRRPAPQSINIHDVFTMLITCWSNESMLSTVIPSRHNLSDKFTVQPAAMICDCGGKIDCLNRPCVPK